METPKVDQRKDADALRRLAAAGSAARLSTRAALALYDDAGRLRCPQCGRYASEGAVGDIGYTGAHRGGGIRISAYGHLPGYGCNKPTN